MQRWRGQDDVPSDWGRCVLTIGVFDGVHRGHAELIARAVKAGRSRGVPSVLMTFDPHPMEVVFPGSHPAQLTTLTRRAELAEEMGIDVFLVMPFTADFMKLTPDRYVHELLVERLHVVEVVVGENFTFGKKAAGNVGTLRKAGERFGFAVDTVSLVADQHQSETVTFSSTYIRSCVDAGDVVAAAEALGRPHRVEGVVVRGDGRGKGLGYPHQSDVLRAHPHRGSLRPRHRGRPVWPACCGGLRGPHPRSEEIRLGRRPDRGHGARHRQSAGDSGRSELILG